MRREKIVSASPTEAVINAFFAAIERADREAIAALYADDLGVWHSNDGITQTKAENLRTLGWLTKVATLRYEILERVIDADKVAQRHRVEMKARTGDKSAVSEAAIFFTVRDGLICRIDEYIDSDSVRKLTALFS